MLGLFCCRPFVIVVDASRLKNSVRGDITRN